jgi:hypothetical protein
MLQDDQNRNWFIGAAVVSIQVVLSVTYCEGSRHCTIEQVTEAVFEKRLPSYYQGTNHDLCDQSLFLSVVVVADFTIFTSNYFVIKRGETVSSSFLWHLFEVLLISF